MRCHLGVGEKKVFPSEERKRLRTARGKVAHLFVMSDLHTSQNNAITRTNLEKHYGLWLYSAKDRQGALDLEAGQGASPYTVQPKFGSWMPGIAA